MSQSGRNLLTRPWMTLTSCPGSPQVVRVVSTATTQRPNSSGRARSFQDQRTQVRSGVQPRACWCFFLPLDIFGIVQLEFLPQVRLLMLSATVKFSANNLTYGALGTVFSSMMTCSDLLSCENTVIPLLLLVRFWLHVTSLPTSK